MNMGQIAPYQGDQMLFIKFLGVGSENASCLLDLLSRLACITLVWCGSEFLCTKQVTQGNPGTGPLICFKICGKCTQLSQQARAVSGKAMSCEQHC